MVLLDKKFYMWDDDDENKEEIGTQGSSRGSSSSSSSSGNKNSIGSYLASDAVEAKLLPRRTCGREEVEHAANYYQGKSLMNNDSNDTSKTNIIQMHYSDYFDKLFNKDDDDDTNESKNNSSSTGTNNASIGSYLASDAVEARLLPRRTCGMEEVENAANYYQGKSLMNDDTNADASKTKIIQNHYTAYFDELFNKGDGSNERNNSNNSNREDKHLSSTSHLPPHRLTSRVWVNLAAGSTTVTRTVSGDIDSSTNAASKTDVNSINRQFISCHPLWKVHSTWEGSLNLHNQPAH